MPNHGRVPFTNDEDRLLIKYIATYNPPLKGRAGNNLYKRLCENADKKWKWSRSHTWQSWRDRYCKNQFQFDREILRYQKKNNIVPEEVEQNDGDGVEDASGTQMKRKREPEAEAKRAKIKREPEATQVLASDQGKESDRVSARSKGKGRMKSAEYTSEPQYRVREREPDDAISGNQAKVTDTPSRYNPSIPTPIASSSKYSNPGNVSSPNIASETDLLSSGQRIPSITYQTLRRTMQADAQPVASNSKVQLTPQCSGIPDKAKVPRNPQRRKPVKKDDGFFASSPSSSPPASPGNANTPKPRKAKLVEGPFGTHFASRRQSGPQNDDSPDDEDEKSGLPLRGKRDLLNGKGNAIENRAGQIPLQTTRNGDNDPSSVPPLQVDAVDHPVAHTAKRPTGTGPPSLKTNRGHAESPLVLQLPKEASGQPTLLRGPSALSRSLSTATRPSHNGDNIGMRSRGSTKAVIPRKSWTPSNLFISKDETNNLTRRHSFANLQEIHSSVGRRLDLRAEMAKSRMAASTPFSRRREQSVATTASYQPSNTSFGRATPPLTTQSNQSRRQSLIADEDREHIELLGLTAAIEEIARDSGFQVDQIWHAYKAYGTVKRTAEFIRLYRQNSARVQELTHEQMLRKGMGALALVEDQQTSITDSPAGHAIQSKPKRRSSTVGSLSSSPSKESRLRIKPMPDIMPLPLDYSPPPDTRAGEWNRLTGQGREEEALSREHLRASGSGGVFPSLRSSPAIYSTPRKNSPIKDEENIGREEVVEEDDDVEVEQMLDTMEEDTDSGTMLSKEEERMLLNARAGIAHELQAIEERVGVEFMRQWLAAHFREEEENVGEKERQEAHVE